MSEINLAGQTGAQIAQLVQDGTVTKAQAKKFVAERAERKRQRTIEQFEELLNA